MYGVNAMFVGDTQWTKHFLAYTKVWDYMAFDSFWFPDKIRIFVILDWILQFTWQW